MKTNRVNERIVRGGMGGFLCPPGHPAHQWSVETDLRQKAENRGGMSLESALEAEWVDSGVKAEARRLLRDWDQWKLPIDSEEVTAWIRSTLAYFRGCYRNPAYEGIEAWHAGNVVIDRDRDPLANADDHAGVRIIRLYYPEFRPTAEDFTGKWGE